MPKYSAIGRLATFDSSSVRLPFQPGSTYPAVEWMSRPNRPSELLCVGMNDLETRKTPLGEATWMHRTGTDGTSLTTSMARNRWNAAVEGRWRASFRPSRNTGRSGVNLTLYFGPISRPLSVARPSDFTGRKP